MLPSTSSLLSLLPCCKSRGFLCLSNVCWTLLQPSMARYKAPLSLAPEHSHQLNALVCHLTHCYLRLSYFRMRALRAIVGSDVCVCVCMLTSLYVFETRFTVYIVFGLVCCVYRLQVDFMSFSIVLLLRPILVH